MFPMQLLGLEVDPIYSVQFSNHTGYPSFKGAVGGAISPGEGLGTNSCSVGRGGGQDTCP